MVIVGDHTRSTLTIEKVGLRCQQPPIEIRKTFREGIDQRSESTLDATFQNKNRDIAQANGI
jgi:hypothetical protein